MPDAMIAVDDPRRAARMVAMLAGMRRAGPARFRLRADSDEAAIVEVPLNTPHSIERIIEIACTEGFHAEPVADGVEFWIDEHCALMLRPPAGTLLLRLAA